MHNTNAQTNGIEKVITLCYMIRRGYILSSLVCRLTLVELNPLITLRKGKNFERQFFLL